ncbi:MAG TPA: FRG domain-containing protein [Candidatus Dormibacteraeota bacterium]|nr:FRG domain-containing protein [Candidatus Dormibacteraeota bacterium]
MDCWNGDWKTGRESWLTFLDHVDKVRDDLGCFYKNAWFRGTVDLSYRLLPSLFRTPQGIADGLTRFDEQIQELEAQFDEGHAEKQAAYGRFHASQSKTPQNNVALEKLKTAKARLKQIRQKQQNLREERENILIAFRNRCLSLDSLREIESDAFISFSQRSGMHEKRSSWEVLAEMAHYGGQTRLLDWTQSLSVALFFALRHYRIRLEAQWNADRELLREWPAIDSLNEGRPCIWILNPFLLSLWATNGERSSIWDFTYDRTHDYHASFLEKPKAGDAPNWPYSFPLPIYPPWRDLRIGAQRGVFTVHGNDVRPLEEQRPNRDLASKLDRAGIPPKPIVAQLEIPKAAAIYGVRHLRRYEGIDNYLLFRDADSLGRSVQEETEEAKLNRSKK